MTTPTIPDLTAVESSNISHIGHDKDAKVLYIRFKSGGLYKYRDVPAKVHEDFMKAESKGKHFRTHFAGKYQHEKIE